MNNKRLLHISHNLFDGSMSISFNYGKPILVNLLASENQTVVDIHGVTIEELEYMASELKRIADSIED